MHLWDFLLQLPGEAREENVKDAKDAKNSAEDHDSSTIYSFIRGLASRLVGCEDSSEEG